jgi:hypothetical protein
MSGAETPQMQIRQSITIGFEHSPHALRHAAIGIHVEQDGTGVPHQSVGPGGDNHGAAQSLNRVHPSPAEKAPQQ